MTVNHHYLLCRLLSHQLSFPFSLWTQDHKSSIIIKCINALSLLRIMQKLDETVLKSSL